MWLPALIALLALAGESLAQSIVLPQRLEIDGQVFDGVSYVSHDDARLKIQHESGIANLLISELPGELQSKLEYDEEKATQAVEQDEARRASILAQAEAEVQKQAEEATKKAERESKAATARAQAFHVWRFLPEGILVKRLTGNRGDALLIGYKKAVAEDDRIWPKAFESSIRDINVDGEIRKLRVYDAVE